MRQGGHDHGEYDESDAGEEECGIALRLLEKAFHGADDEGEADSDGESDAHTRRIDSGDEEEVGEIEEDTGKDSGPDEGGVGGVEVFSGGDGGRSARGEGPGKEKAGWNNADGISTV